MKAIQPTPSQAAVVLKKYLREQGVEMKLSDTQEAVARMWGHASWQALTAATPVRGAPAKAPKPAATVASEKASATIESFEQLSRLFEERQDPEDNLYELADALEAALCDSGLLADYRRQRGRDERCLEKHRPYLQVSFDQRLSDRFVTELVFTLRDNLLQCYVRTWETKDYLDHSRNYEIFDESSGEFDTDAERPEAHLPVTVLIRTALAEAALHKRRLIDKVNVH